MKKTITMTSKQADFLGTDRRIRVSSVEAAELLDRVRRSPANARTKRSLILKLVDASKVDRIDYDRDGTWTLHAGGGLTIGQVQVRHSIGDHGERQVTWMITDPSGAPLAHGQQNEPAMLSGQVDRALLRHFGASLLSVRSAV